MSALKRKIEFVVDGECFICTSHIANNKKTGHLKYWKHGRQDYIHRHVFEEMFGEIPQGMVIMHTCDNPKCINPEHLKLGTQKDNIHDMMDKDRQGHYFGKIFKRWEG